MEDQSLHNTDLFKQEEGQPCMREKHVLMQVARVDELHQQATKYCAQLQEYNGRLQSDAQSASERLKAIQVSPLISRYQDGLLPAAQEQRSAACPGDMYIGCIEAWVH